MLTCRKFTTLLRPTCPACSPSTDGKQWHEEIADNRTVINALVLDWIRLLDQSGPRESDVRGTSLESVSLMPEVSG